MKTVAIVGPTAAGKSDLGLKIAGDLFEIVSADSVQVYRYMDIGSGKPDVEERKLVKHHLIDIVEPDFHFTAGEFCSRALIACSEIDMKRKIPLFVGGTGLYIDSFFGGISDIPEIDQCIKFSLSEEADRIGLGSLYDSLLKIDPEFAMKIHHNDRQRIIRGLEVYRGTGKLFSEYLHNKKKNQKIDVLFIGIYLDKTTLNCRIDSRVDRMIKRGLIEEVDHLRKMGFNPELNSMKSIGYAEINEYIDGRVDLTHAIQNIKSNTRKYAKKQITWFKKNKEINWFDAGEIKKIQEKIKNWLN